MYTPEELEKKLCIVSKHVSKGLVSFGKAMSCIDKLYNATRFNARDDEDDDDDDDDDMDDEEVRKHLMKLYHKMGNRMNNRGGSRYSHY